MKIAVIGSRTLTVRNLEKYIPKDTNNYKEADDISIKYMEDMLR